MLLSVGGVGGGSTRNVAGVLLFPTSKGARASARRGYDTHCHAFVAVTVAVPSRSDGPCS